MPESWGCWGSESGGPTRGRAARSLPRAGKWELRAQPQDSRPSTAGGRAASPGGGCFETPLEGTRGAAGEPWGRPRELGTGMESGLSPSLTPVSTLHKLGLVFTQPQGKFDSMLRYVNWQDNFFS